MLRERLKFSLSDASACSQILVCSTEWLPNLRIISRLSGSPCSPSPQQSNVKSESLNYSPAFPQSPSHMFFCFQLGASSGKAICLATFHLTLTTTYIYRAFYIINGDNNSLEHSFNSRNPWSLNIKQWSIHACLVTPLCLPKDLKRICWICTV